MSNSTDPSAQTVHGTNPQYLIEKITRLKIYNCTYWKEECFGLTAATVIDKAVQLKYIAGTYGGNNKPSRFLCLLLKTLQLQPDKDIVLEFIRNDDFKYLRALGAIYLRLTSKAEEVYRYLEPLYNDYRPLVFRNSAGWSVIHMDEFIDSLLREELVCDIAMPFILKRLKLEELNTLPRRKSAMDEELAELERLEQEAAAADEEEEEEGEEKGDNDNNQDDEDKLGVMTNHTNQQSSSEVKHHAIEDTRDKAVSTATNMHSAASEVSNHEKATTARVEKPKRGRSRSRSEDHDHRKSAHGSDRDRHTHKNSDKQSHRSSCSSSSSRSRSRDRRDSRRNKSDDRKDEKRHHSRSDRRVDDDDYARRDKHDRKRVDDDKDKVAESGKERKRSSRSRSRSYSDDSRRKRSHHKKRDRSDSRDRRHKHSSSSRHRKHRYDSDDSRSRSRSRSSDRGGRKHHKKHHRDSRDDSRDRHDRRHSSHKRSRLEDEDNRDRKYAKIEQTQQPAAAEPEEKLEAFSSKPVASTISKKTSEKVFDKMFGKKKPTEANNSSNNNLSSQRGSNQQANNDQVRGKVIVNDKGEKFVITASEGTVEYWNQMREALGMKKLRS